MDGDTFGMGKDAVATLQGLPTEVLIRIFSYLDEKDFLNLQESCKQFEQIINDEELWKNLFVSRIYTQFFPSFSKSPKYSIEYIERTRGLNEWRHNRAVKTKYTVATQNVHNQLEKVIFEYPRCACYSDGVIMIVQLHSKRRKDRLTYMPCTTPQGCSTMHFNINAAVFGRFDGRVFGKLLTNKSHLSPVTEFDALHSACVTAITTAALEDSREDWCVSGSENGEIIWWCEAKMRRKLRLSQQPILRVAMNRDTTVVMDLRRIYVVEQMEAVDVIDVPYELARNPNQLHFFKIDFGGKLLIIGDTRRIYVISINPHKDFGFTRSLEFVERIQDIGIDEVTSKRQQNSHIAGGDGCFLAIMTADNSVTTINIRAPGTILRTQTKLDFKGELFACKVNNLVLVCAFSESLGIFDAANGTELRVVRKTEKIPQFLDVSHGRMIVGSGNVLNYLQYTTNDEPTKRKHSVSSKTRSNKWTDVLHTQLDLYNEDEKQRVDSIQRSQTLQRRFVGDVEDEELQLEIAMMESRDVHSHSLPQVHNGEEQDDELLLALEQSRLSYEGDVNTETRENDQELFTALRLSSAESTNRINSRRLERRRAPLGEYLGPDSSHFANEAGNRNSLSPSTNDITPHSADRLEYDEDLQLAFALSLSEERN
ncbi:LAMI_0G15148g1_1 [Lachancea mirantina]|uniref:LAMI_0G15148g1_1 n=1 Tax=Lachancea mirantina TaxID=1230905 RepID=A0A1G4KCF4_9SACH|nr:LAMI_0G15148g1_1 [Lachancea mirantina]